MVGFRAGHGGFPASGGIAAGVPGRPPDAAARSRALAICAGPATRIRAGRFGEDESMAFIHAGGSDSLFGYRQIF